MPRPLPAVDAGRLAFGSHTPFHALAKPETLMDAHAATE